MSANDQDHESRHGEHWDLQYPGTCRYCLTARGEVAVPEVEDRIVFDEDIDGDGFDEAVISCTRVHLEMLDDDAAYIHVETPEGIVHFNLSAEKNQRLAVTVEDMRDI